ncbi:MAG TPA: CoA transferase [Gaiellaceae bacterium]|nr:CoA transferase [Gaiellaceae bacterium]
MSLPLLEGYRVLELTETPGGAFCAKLFADLGADVLKVEPRDGDPARRRGAFPRDIPDGNASGLFLYLNANKRSLTLDLAKPTASEIATRLALAVDVVVEDHTPGYLVARGLGFAELHAANPALVIISLTPFGQTGPRAGWKATPLTVYHAGGHASHLSPATPHRPPVTVGGLAGEYQAGIVAALAGLAALFGREATGGQHVDVSKQEALVNLARSEHGRYPNEGVLVSRTNPDAPFVGGMLPCRDGWVECVVMEEHQWDALRTLLGEPAWTAQPAFSSQPARLEHAGELHERLAAETRTRSADELYERGQALGCPIGKVLSAPEILASGQLRSRGFFTAVDDPAAGRLEYPSVPFAAAGETRLEDRPAPRLGEHTAPVLAELGYGDDDTAALLGTGVV